MARMKVVADKVSREAILQLNKSIELTAALRCVDEWLGELQILLPDCGEAVSFVTGEVVCGDELKRVRGILDAFENSDDFQIDWK